MIYEEYGILLESGVGKEANIMCNLSELIEEEALERGIGIDEARGEARLILNLHRKGYTAEQIVDMTDKPMEEVKAIIEKKQALLV